MHTTLNNIAVLTALENLVSLLPVVTTGRLSLGLKVCGYILSSTLSFFSWQAYSQWGDTMWMPQSIACVYSFVLSLAEPWKYRYSSDYNLLCYWTFSQHPTTTMLLRATYRQIWPSERDFITDWNFNRTQHIHPLFEANFKEAHVSLNEPAGFVNEPTEVFCSYIPATNNSLKNPSRCGHLIHFSILILGSLTIECKVKVDPLS